jgi:hypothetical protein
MNETGSICRSFFILAVTGSAGKLAGNWHIDIL